MLIEILKFGSGIFAGVWIEKLNESAKRRRTFRDNLQLLKFRLQNASAISITDTHQSTLEAFDKYAAIVIEDVWWNNVAFGEACDAYRDFKIFANKDECGTLLQSGYKTRTAAKEKAIALLAEVANQTRFLDSFFANFNRARLPKTVEPDCDNPG